MSIVSGGEMDVVCQESRARDLEETSVVLTLGFVGRPPTRLGQFHGHTYYRRETLENTDNIFIFEHETKKLQISV